MNYYSHHLGDYAKNTGHLSITEHGAYRLLMDHYYSTETPLPSDPAKLARIARATTPAEKAAVKRVAEEFFETTPEGLKHSRIEEEIEEYRKTCAKNSANGKSGGRPRKNPVETHEKPSGLFLGSVSETQTKPSQYPLPNPSTQSLPSGEPSSPQDAPAIPPVTLEQARQRGPQAGVPPDVAESWWLDNDARGWVDRSGQPIRNWLSSLTAYGRRWQANDHQQQQAAKTPQKSSSTRDFFS